MSKDQMLELLHSGNMVYDHVYRGDQETEYLFQNTPENIANFIGSRPTVDQIILTDVMDWPILSTIGYFIDKCPDQDLLAEIKRTLVPIQTGQAEVQPFFCPTIEEVEDYWEKMGALAESPDETPGVFLNEPQI